MSMEKRFFVNAEDVIQETIKLTGEEHNHLSKVLRLRVGDSVECFYDNSAIYVCEIKLITKTESVLKIVSTYECKANPKLNITLYQALPKLDKLELVAQKLTEIGVSKIVPFSSTFCIAKDNANKIERLKKIVISACKQCGRTSVPCIENTIKFTDLLQELKNYDLVVFANETENNNLLKDKISGKNVKNVAYIVGSEGGFSKQEIDELNKFENVCSITLGKRILRTETASIILGALLCYELGEI